MNSKPLFFRFVLFLLAILTASGVLIPSRYNKPYPAKLGPEFDAIVKNEHRHGIEQNKPDIVLIGDSTLKEGVDGKLLAKELDKGVYSVPIPGSGTAAWYLFMKNVIFKADHMPEYVVIFFRITILTVPQYRTGGKYFFLLDDYARKNEPLVADLAFINLMSPFEKFATQYIPVYSSRVGIRADLDGALRYQIPSAAGCDRTCTDDAIGSIFGREVDPLALNVAQEDAAKLLFDPREFDFDRQISTSLLPYMIELAQSKDATLVFVRTKIYGPEPKELIEYTHKLDAYLAGQENVVLLDYSNDPRIMESFYVDSLHMNPYGKYEFTKILAGEFKIFLSK